MEAETGNLHDSAGYRNSASNYASSADNISRLLEGWRTRSSEKLNGSKEGNRLPQAAGIDVNVETCSLFSPDKPLARPSEAEENPSLTFLEKWLFDDTTGQLEGLVELAPPISYNSGRKNLCSSVHEIRRKMMCTTCINRLIKLSDLRLPSVS
ncbi:hypothetical protein HPP92_013826 [Vanilla planifolia]|uniref:Uncharacterized protein n=1 Tax=Vanilla planifolia TaxID=51239 RepID=A0A835UYU6_VANPL|nr:hypothetical protein HPP92_014353 [Vanilla planifolia]KAG0479107.1 hypothetical protein HPP92_013826 [Vanilla planifolia]